MTIRMLLRKKGNAGEIAVNILLFTMIIIYYLIYIIYVYGRTVISYVGLYL